MALPFEVLASPLGMPAGEVKPYGTFMMDVDSYFYRRSGTKKDAPLSKVLREQLIRMWSAEIAKEPNFVSMPTISIVYYSALLTHFPGLPGTFKDVMSRAKAKAALANSIIGCDAALSRNDRIGTAIHRRNTENAQLATSARTFLVLPKMTTITAKEGGVCHVFPGLVERTGCVLTYFQDVTNDIASWQSRLVPVQHLLPEILVKVDKALERGLA